MKEPDLVDIYNHKPELHAKWFIRDQCEPDDEERYDELVEALYKIKDDEG